MIGLAPATTENGEVVLRNIRYLQVFFLALAFTIKTTLPAAFAQTATKPPPSKRDSAGQSLSAERSVNVGLQAQQFFRQKGAFDEAIKAGKVTLDLAKRRLPSNHTVRAAA